MYNRVRKPYLSDVSIIVYTKYSVFHLRGNGDEWVCTGHIRERGPQRPGFWTRNYTQLIAATEILLR